MKQNTRPRRRWLLVVELGATALAVGGFVWDARIPLRGEVEWPLPEGPQPYWRGSVTAVTFAYEVQGS